MKKLKSCVSIFLIILLMLSSCAQNTADNATNTVTTAVNSQERLPITDVDSDVESESGDSNNDENNGDAGTDEPILPLPSFTLTEEEFYDRLLGGWLAEMVGVSWAASTEFDYCHQMMPANQMPAWSPELINNAYNQDDCYVEIPFLATMNDYGAFCDVNYMANNFRDSAFNLYHANKQARNNLRAGISYPYSGAFGICSDDIDWQIESDFLGMIYPGLVNEAALRSFEIGHIMNYGDGVYGGVFVAAMHSAAFYAESIEEVVEIGISVIPDGSKFKLLMTDMMNNYKSGKTLEENWTQIENKWGRDQVCGKGGRINIDAKLNASYVAMGLLYGEGDLAKTIITATRCGQDSDCNPSSAASILGNFYGASALPTQYIRGINLTGKSFSHTEYSLQEVLDISVKLMKEILVEHGAVLKDGVWYIPLTKEYKVVPFEQYGDCFVAHLAWTDAGNNTVNLTLETFGDVGIRSLSVDMGDGTVLDQVPSTYTYKKPGTYTVTFRVIGKNGTVFEDTRTVTVSNLIKLYGTPICSVTNPNGGGSKSLSVICDGEVPFGSTIEITKQYDTYVRNQFVSNAWIGYEFSKAYTISQLLFIEGQHFDDGGWFSDIPRIELLIDGTWVAVDASISPSYSANNANHTQCESYLFTITNPQSCSGIRIVGTPGGSAKFISASEIVAYYQS